MRTLTQCTSPSGQTTRRRDRKNAWHERVKGDRTFRLWHAMRARCKYPSQASYKHYGGKGIRICERWEDYSLFLADLGPCPDGYSLDRLDSNGHYEPSNCRWTTMKTQQRNRTNNQVLTFNGKSQPIAAWAEEIGLKQKTLRARIFDYGWSLEEALTKKLGVMEYGKWNPRPYVVPYKSRTKARN